MTQDEKLISLDSAVSNIKSVLLTLDPESNRHQALSVALEQVEWVNALFKKDDYPPTTMQIEFKKVWRCLCRLSLPKWGAATVDGYIRCQECKRVWTSNGILLGSEVDNKTKATGEKDLPEPVICGYGFLESWNTDIAYCHLPKGHEGSHVA